MISSNENVPDNTRAALAELGTFWGERIKAAEKREERWVKQAESAECIYMAGAEKDGLDFNTLFANVETIVPAVYNSTPIPDFRPRQRDDHSEAPRKVADMLEKVTEQQIDDDRLTREIEASVRDSYIAGRGLTRVRYNDDGDGENQRVEYEAVAFRDFRIGLAKRWDDVPWVAFRHIMEDETDLDADLIAIQREKEDEEAAKEFAVWEIWDKEKRRVIMLRERDNAIVKQMDDPMGLSRFFPVAEPMQPIKVTGKMAPVCPYEIYRKLAQEIDVATKRIAAITKGLKVVGLIAGDATDIANIAEAEDNTLIPVMNEENWQLHGGLEGAISWWPVDRAIQVLQQLYLSREQAKQAVYEVTGIADIVRGASDARETLGAQEMKGKWGSLRIKRMQGLVERHVRELFVLTVEIIFNQFEPANMQEISGVEIDGEMAVLLQQGLRQYRIDVESDSTVRSDLSRSKGEMADFMRATVEFFTGMAPIVQAQPAALNAAIALYSAHARQYNLGKQAEDALQELIENASSREAIESAEQERQEAKQKAEAIEMAEQQRKDREVAVKEGELERKSIKDRMDDINADEKLELEYDKLRKEAALEATQNRPVAL